MNEKQDSGSAGGVMGKKIVVGLSGGVDSSVALLLLKRQGWQPIGVSLKMAVWKSKCNALRENVCCTDESFGNAARVCEKLGVPHYIYNVEREFEQKVMGYFVSELGIGRTPNPCLICNRDLKIKMLFEWAKKHGIRHVATGHYASIERGKLARAIDMKKDQTVSPRGALPPLVRHVHSAEAECIRHFRCDENADRPNPPLLMRAIDMKKDQTYGLCLVPRAWLPRLVLPLGKLSKQDVYDIAISEGLGFYAGVSQSQDLCFVSEHARKPFLFEKLGKQEGDMLDEQGRRVGTHYGLFLYTVGQRKGLGLPIAHFVKGFDVKKNALIVTQDRTRVLEKKFLVEKFNWLIHAPPKRKFSAMVQIRTHQPEVAAIITPRGKGSRALDVECALPIEGIAPGQICAIYKNSRCLGGGAIEKALE